MTTATREIRPFGSFGVLEEFVHAVCIEVGSDVLSNDSSLVLSEYEYRHVPVSVQLAASDAAFEQSLHDVMKELQENELSPSDISLIVNLYSGFLKISEFPFNALFADLGKTGRIISLTSAGCRPDALLAAKSGCQIEVAAVLSKQLEPKPLRPWRKGTWLARSRYRLSSETVFNGFTPRPLTKEAKEVFGLPSATTRYVVVPDGIDPLSDEASAELVELWVDADLLAAVSARDASVASIAFQQQLFVDAFSAVVVAAKDQSEFGSRSWQDSEGSMVGKMIKALTGRRKSDSDEAVRNRCEYLFELMKNNHPAFMAHVEAFSDTTSAFLKTMEV
jgi:hypothetical protein